MSISRRSFFRRVAGVMGGGGLAAVIERQETPVDVPVQVIERVRCSKCGRLYEDGEKECRVCSKEVHVMPEGTLQWKVPNNMTGSGTAFSFYWPSSDESIPVKRG